MPTLDPDRLRKFATRLLEAGGATPEEADCVAHSLVESNLRGYESHGVMRIPSYIDMMATGTIVSGAPFKITAESPTHLVADAAWGFGQMQASRMLNALIKKTGESGMAIGSLIHSGHVGRLGEYCERAAAESYLSMMMVNSHGAVVRVAPPGGRAPRLSTNPLAMGVPCGDSPLILDFSTSATAEGKVRVKRIAGQQVPEGWLIDNQGEPTTDPAALYADPPGAILPMGGAQAYKGFGLGLMIEIFTGALSGGATARPKPYPKNGNCVFLMLLDTDRFGGQKHFASEVAQLVDYLRSCPRRKGVDRIVLPGDPERAVYAERRINGIFLDDENWAQLATVAERLKVESDF